MERDGSFTVGRRGRGLRALLNLYHSLLRVSWPVFVCLLVGVYLVLNAAFALGYLACGPGAVVSAVDPEGATTFAHAFFLSVQTFSTVGYGGLLPVGVPANVLMTVQSVLGLLTTALATGLVFARFSRPTADVAFSECAVVAPYRGIRGLMVRVANRRSNLLVNMEAELMLSQLERRADGTVTRRFERLALERDAIAFFPLSWTIVHPIDAASPLARATAETFAQLDGELFVILRGVDEDSSQMVTVRCSYKPSEVRWGARFSNIYHRHEAGNPVAIDIDRLHDAEGAPEAAVPIIP